MHSSNTSLLLLLLLAFFVIWMGVTSLRKKGRKDRD